MSTRASSLNVGAPSRPTHCAGACAAQPAPTGTSGASRKANEFAVKVRPVIEQMQRDGHTSLWALARELNLKGVAPARAREWHASSVRNVLSRLRAISSSRVRDGEDG